MAAAAMAAAAAPEAARAGGAPLQEQGSVIKNPILRGFHPDPSILRVGDDYYIACSTFQWWPGVPIYHSRDLVHFRLLTHLLTRQSQLDLSATKDSGGVYAPQISYKDGLFYLVYTNVLSGHWPFLDCSNYVITAPSIMGPWSEPKYLHGMGFDPSLFHDQDGKTYLLSNEIDFRPEAKRSRGIVMQEFSTDRLELVGEPRLLTDAEAEGPHLYRHGDHYYLLTAEGGTQYEHRMMVYRAPTLDGPFVVDPAGPVLTSANTPERELQKAGHASLVETQAGEFFVAHLCARPLAAERKCPLGRETALQRVKYDDEGWLRMDSGTSAPDVHVRGPSLPLVPWPRQPTRMDFDTEELPQELICLREPFDDSWISLRRRPGHLSLRGRHSLMSPVRQSLVARRIQSLRSVAQTALDFQPTSYRQMAGLCLYYDCTNYMYLCLSRGERRRELNLWHANGFWNVQRVLEQGVPLPPSGAVHLRAELEQREVRFSYALDGERFVHIGPTFDAAELSDEHGKYAFTGAVAALCAQDLAQQACWAEFDYFDCSGHEP